MDRLLGEYRLSRDTPEARQQFHAALEPLRAREAKAENEPYAEIRRGGCFGSAGFRQELLEKHGDATGEHHTREIARENEPSRAERIIREELAKAGWNDTHLDERPKNDPVKLELGGAAEKGDRADDKTDREAAFVGNAEERDDRTASVDADPTDSEGRKQRPRPATAPEMKPQTMRIKLRTPFTDFCRVKRASVGGTLFVGIDVIDEGLDVFAMTQAGGFLARLQSGAEFRIVLRAVGEDEAVEGFPVRYGSFHMTAHPITDFAVRDRTANEGKKLFGGQTRCRQPASIESLGEVGLVVFAQSSGGMETDLVNEPGEVNPTGHGFTRTSGNGSGTHLVARKFRQKPGHGNGCGALRFAWNQTRGCEQNSLRGAQTRRGSVIQPRTLYALKMAMVSPAKARTPYLEPRGFGVSLEFSLRPGQRRWMEIVDCIIETGLSIAAPKPGQQKCFSRKRTQGTQRWKKRHTPSRQASVFCDLCDLLRLLAVTIPYVTAGLG